jgi:Sulfotransferase family
LRKLTDIVHHQLFRAATRYRLPTGHRRIYFYHVLKTAGTSLNQMVLLAARNAAVGSSRSASSTATRVGEVDCEGRFSIWLPRVEADDGAAILKALWDAHRHRLAVNGLVFQAADKKRIEQGNYFFAFSHVPAHELRLPERTFTITGIRNPVDRLLSYYQMLLAQRATGQDRSHDRYLLADDFDGFLRRLPREKLLAQLYHFSSTFDPQEAYTRIARCNFVYFVEELNRVLPKLSGGIGLVMKSVNANRSVVNFAVTDEQRCRLNGLLEPEIRLYERLHDNRHEIACDNYQRIF